MPADHTNREFLLDWTDAARVPWGILLLLLGAGFSLANGFQESGMDTTITQSSAGIVGVPLTVLVLVVATAVVFLTEVTSNTATASVFTPIMITLDVSPLVLMATTALAA